MRSKVAGKQPQGRQFADGERVDDRVKPDRETAIAPDKLRVAYSLFAFIAGIFDERPDFREKDVGSFGALSRSLTEPRGETDSKCDGNGDAEQGGDGLEHRL
jgi:hypothetical protein